MNKKFGWILGILVVAVVALGAFGTSVAYADDGGPGHRMDRFDDETIQVVADLLGMSADELTTAIEDGAALHELADAAGVEMQEIRDAVRELKGDSIRDRSPLLDGEALDTVADMLGMTPEEVIAALEDGTTLEELANEAGVEIEEIKDALSELRTETVRERIETALEEGNLTEDEAGWLLEGVDNGYFAKLRNFMSHRGGHPKR